MDYKDLLLHALNDNRHWLLQKQATPYEPTNMPNMPFKPNYSTLGMPAPANAHFPMSAEPTQHNIASWNQYMNNLEQAAQAAQRQEMMRQLQLKVIEGGLSETNRAIGAAGIHPNGGYFTGGKSDLE